jgi:hypothetical protein
MGQETTRRDLISAAVRAATISLALAAGCGGGSARNLDDGIVLESDGTKSIARTLENRGSTHVKITLRLDGELLRYIHIEPGGWHTVEIYNLYPEDVISFYAEWDGGERASGTFSQDGRTIFDDRSRSVDTRIRNMEGRAAVDRSNPAERVKARAGKPSDKG